MTFPKTRCRYVGQGREPAAGTIGTAWPAPGFSDHESSQYMTFLFEADNGHGVLYSVSPLDLDAITIQTTDHHHI